jgi:hypothetical protein
MNYKVNIGIMLDLNEKEFKVLRAAVFRYEMEVKSGRNDFVVSEREYETLDALSAELSDISEHLDDWRN